MTTFLAPLAKAGGSLAALAAALALAAPAAAQEMPTFQPDDPAPAPAPAPAPERSYRPASPNPPAPPPRPGRSYAPIQAEDVGGPARVEMARPEPAPSQRFERSRYERPAANAERPAFEPRASRFEPAPEPRTEAPAAPFAPRAAPSRVEPDNETRAAFGQRPEARRGGRWRQGGFGDEGTRAEIVQRERQEARSIEPRGDLGEPRAERVQPARPAERVEGRRGEWQGERRDGVQQRGQAGWQNRRDSAQSDNRNEWQRRRDNTRADNSDGWQGRDDGRAVAGRDDWRDGRRANGSQRDDWRRNGWHDGRRSDWYRDRRDWRRDDWRWSWNGRAGWDRRDFRRWDNRWRINRSYNWFDYRSANRIIYSPGIYYAPFRSHRYTRLSIGWFLDSLFFQPRFFINDPWSYRLPPVYGPYQWVRYYDDVLLVDIYTGEVVDVIYGFFW